MLTVGDFQLSRTEYPEYAGGPMVPAIWIGRASGEGMATPESLLAEALEKYYAEHF